MNGACRELWQAPTALAVIICALVAAGFVLAAVRILRSPLVRPLERLVVIAVFGGVVGWLASTVIGAVRVQVAPAVFRSETAMVIQPAGGASVLCGASGWCMNIPGTSMVGVGSVRSLSRVADDLAAPGEGRALRVEIVPQGLRRIEVCPIR